MSVTILLVEDNESIIMGLEYLLIQEGYQPCTARTLREAEELIREHTPDLVLLDVSLPDGNGFTFCREIRKNDNCPVIFLTASEEEADVVRGFDLGAEDYIIKPFRNRELISRIKRVLLRSGKGNILLKCGDIVLNLETGKVCRAGRELNLTKPEYRILSLMMTYPGKLFAREEILAGIWDLSGNFVNDNTLSVTMKRIREKLDDAEGEIIRTVRGIGYRLEA
ncbi:transcriptional regulatory protein WalR [Lachnospiraceae bacterium]|nr:transcriptional regulatory protein WalR [Lachnospiraceae bacterium]